MQMQPPKSWPAQVARPALSQKEEYEKTKRDMLAARFFQDDSEMNFI